MQYMGMVLNCAPVRSTNYFSVQLIENNKITSIEYQHSITVLRIMM